MIMDLRYRRSFLRRVAAVGLALSAGLMSGGCSKPDASPNVVIIFTDDQGYADVGVYGATGYSTPHLDRLASEGMRFTVSVLASPRGRCRRILMLPILESRSVSPSTLKPD